MSYGLYMDVHVHSGITRGVRQRGVDVLTAQEDGTTKLADGELLDRATALDRLLFTNDRDFLTETARRLRVGKRFVAVVFVKPLEVSHKTCIDDLELIVKASKPEEVVNRVIFLPL